MTKWLTIIAADDIGQLRRPAVDADALEDAREIVADVQQRGDQALRAHGIRLGDLESDTPMIYGAAQLDEALDDLDAARRDVLERTAKRIETFAAAQRSALSDISVQIPGGQAGHRVAPVDRAGCYAPGGRFALPSSVLMTACTAKVAGVETVWVASPRPDQITLAAAAVAGADAVLGVGGAQAIAALAWGTDQIPGCDVIVGPGNRWVTAAKKLVSGRVRIDMLAGPSELVVLADKNADAATVAADLLAQAEHDPDALVILVALDAGVVEAVDAQIDAQLADLSTRDTAQAALQNGGAVIAQNIAHGIEICDRIAPEHLELVVDNAQDHANDFNHYGGLFIGESAAEVLGDYGAGPNHTLPTGGTARTTGGLSVFNFLRIRTRLHIDDPRAATSLVDDAADLARLEGLEAHARSAEKRRDDGNSR